MLTELTSDQKRIMLETRDEWINLFFDNVRNKRGIDKPAFEEGIKWLYNDLLKKPTPKIIYCDGWLSCLLTIAILKDKNLIKKSWDSVMASVKDSVMDSVRASIKASVGDSVRASVWDSVGDSVWDSVWDSVGDSVWDSVGASVRDSVGDSVWDSVWDSVGDSVWDSVGDSVRASVWDSVWDSVGDSVWDSVGDSVNEYSSYIDLSNYGWVSFYDFFEKINLLDNFNFKQYKKLIRSNVFNAYEYENYVFAIQPPVYIETNLAGRLHSTTQAAVQFRDGSEYYFINGRSIPAWIVNDKSSITKERFMKETDADIKGAIYESIGQQGMLDLLGAKVVDRREIVHANGDREVVELLKTNDLFKEIDNQPFAWVSMCCPSTGTHYLQGVEPHHTNAIEAIASLSPFNAKDYSFNFRA
jgi:hypothetical protein